MSRKTLILNGSPRINGNTAALIAELKRHLDGEVVELSAFRSNIAPCVDCRGCWKTARCIVRDDMEVIYSDDFDNVVIASPVYFGTLPGSMLSLISRMQPWHAATYFLQKPLTQRYKKSAGILTAGSRKNTEHAYHHMHTLFKMLNAHGYREHIVCSDNTDVIPAWEDSKAMKEAADLARWLNQD